MVDRETSQAVDVSPRSAGKSGAIRTERLFWADPYATRSDACVVAVEGNEVELDRTVFFAFSGGQESDHGTIAGLAAQGASLDGQRIRYTLPDDHGLAVGHNAVVEIDWSRRYALMRLHCAAELVLEMICAALPGGRAHRPSHRAGQGADRLRLARIAFQPAAFRRRTGRRHRARRSADSQRLQ